MHDVVRSFAEFMAGGESFVVQGNMQVPEGSGNDTKLPVRRMSLGPSDLRLKRISGLPRLSKIRIVRCPNVVVLEGVPSLNSLVLEDVTMESLPGYLRDVTPRYLKLDCNMKLYESISESSCERDKIRHIGKHDIYWIE
nr:unnamed protein product [Digitaria exilis]CAB3492324.1 unnamed protein product [Digitaria exilis]CAB3502787.1 unnamed protein product [Digitaria exilis]